MEPLSNCIIRNPNKMYLCVSETQRENLLKELNLPTEGDWPRPGWANTATYSSGYTIVSIGDTSKFDHSEVYALLAHESVHVFYACMKSIGETECGEEIIAYGIQNILEELIAEYDRNRV